MAAFKTLDDLSVAGKRVLVRADLNVPMQDGKVTDATRIARVAPTIEELAKKGAKVIVLSHFGRPKGKPAPEFSLKPLVPALSAALGGRKVEFGAECLGPAAQAVVSRMQNGDVVLLENTRFYAGEEKNSPEMAAELAGLGDIYVNDAFSAAHRAHASTEGVARLLPSAAGRMMQQELEALEKALTKPARPVMAVIGGAKVSTKLELLGNLVAKVDKLAIGGGMANTFLYAQGVEVGKSLCERDLANTARAILKKAKAGNCTILLQSDAVIADTLAAGIETAVVGVDAVPADKMILDIGPATQLVWEREMAECQTLVWNGPVGAFETAPFDQGTTALAQAAARLTQSGNLLSVAGGGDTVAALAHAGVEEKFTYVSSAGGAFLEWLEGKTLPGVAALSA
ncbi:phosphoglycerate kinase [Oceanibaculum pacificum]|uniref:Phosphoglycerate kinase n=1 Tax=Oceanibaculum pacificum TaxID=580166 RepID=A0A154VKN9_9PROT|nr:phosphoglycerate kinase [Oceanibaculum pacificum]KZD01890.1 phosphoglycerate kinase [Oceanibaculum pacificum]